jgi:hypothetical protein
LATSLLVEQSFASLFRVFPDWDITVEEPCRDYKLVLTGV